MPDEFEFNMEIVDTKTKSVRNGRVSSLTLLFVVTLKYSFGFGHKEHGS